MASSQSSMGNILFRIFWWLMQRINLNWAHRLMYWGLRDGAFPRQTVHEQQLASTLWGHAFPTPFGVGEGIDKKGNVLDNLIYTGFSYGEFGPYTLEKEMPEIKRFFLKSKKAILVQCYGYRNPGINKILSGLVKRRYLPHYVGINLAIPAESEAQNIKQGRHFTYEEEFVYMAQKVAPYCDYIVLNMSHPNSELASLVIDGAIFTLIPIIKSVKEAVHLAAPIQTPPVLLKLPADIPVNEMPAIVQSLMDAECDGVIVSGPLSAARNSMVDSMDSKLNARITMVYGEPGKDKVLDTIRHIYQLSRGKLPIVSCGGVFSAQDAFNNLSAGASLIQMDESALIYYSPSLVFSLQKGLLKLMTEKGYPSLDKLIGADFRIHEQFPQNTVSTNTSVPVSENTVPVAPVTQSQQPNVPVSSGTQEGQNPFSNSTHI